MCGICGVVEAPERLVDIHGLKAMCDSLAHRGPDDEGRYTDGPVGLGQRRLSIIDLASGRQPIGNETGDVWVTYNGEIYNFMELRDDLLHRGHVFTTHTDSEVLVHGYEEWGAELVARLRGMFAFAIYDQKRRRVFLARDRFGIKPLFVAEHKGRFSFASEPKALIAYDRSLADELDPDALALAFTFPYIPAPRSAFKHIRKCPPGHAMIWADGHLRRWRYWDPAATEIRPISEADALARLDAELSDAVKAHLVSDVPLGAFLSGGVDSSAVVAMMARHAGRRVKTFSIAFGHARFNEAPYARQVAEHLGTEHHELTVEAKAAGLVETLADHFDEPFFDSSAIPTYLVSKLAREHVTVILTGDGGDELFGGYTHYLKYMGVQAAGRLPAAPRRLLASALHSAPPASRRASLGRLLTRSLLPFPERYWRAIGWPEEVRRLILKPELLESRAADDAFAGLTFRHRGGLRDAWLFDAGSLLPDDFLTKVDRMSMAHALETRVPLLDHRLAEFAASLPVKLKIRGLTTKYLLKKLTARLVPPQAVYRPKQGFAIPLASWLKNDLREQLHDTLLNPNAAYRAYLDPAGVRTVIERQERGEANWHEVLWSLLFFETWLKRLPQRRDNEEAR